MAQKQTCSSWVTSPNFARERLLPAGHFTESDVGAQSSFTRHARGVRRLFSAAGFHATFLLWGDDDALITSLNRGIAREPRRISRRARSGSMSAAAGSPATP